MRVASALAAVAWAAWAIPVHGAAGQSMASYPQRPVRIIVPLTPGGGVDATARIVADHLSNALGQRFIVDNRPGAGGSIGVELVAGAAKDGYTLLVSSSSLVTNGRSFLPLSNPQSEFPAMNAPYAKADLPEDEATATQLVHSG